MSLTAAADAGSVIVPLGLLTSTTTDCDAGACGPAFALASLKIWVASTDSYFAPWSRETASTALVPPAAMLRRTARS